LLQLILNVVIIITHAMADLL